MIFRKTKLSGVFIVEPELLTDERGFFARTWCRDEFAAHGLNPRLAQCNISFNKKAGTLRGMHYQIAPYEEAKLVRCTRGAIYDVVIDLRPDSETFKHWLAVELTAENRRALYIPESFAHGFQTLVDNTEVFYQMSEFYHPEAARGVRWDDPAFGIVWPEAERDISDKDRRWPLFTEPDRSSPITQEMKTHYSQKFAEFGATSKGVDWSKDEDVRLRYDKMLAVLARDLLDIGKPITLLDVGCGYGGLLAYAQQKGFKLQYTGIDVASNMIHWARQHLENGEFIEGDFMQYGFDERRFEFIVCNGILTQKLGASLLDMDGFAKRLIRRMFDLCSKGIAFNVMSTYVNFFAPNLYYKHPAEMLGYCLSEISRNVRLDHSYGLYEYTLYVYR
ncbi:MAG: dTDP-4-dehydrorhamnose 3,5-epimerase [Chloroflexi bacterium]|nr:dTDP-4-dehydrorhamnose 3,5-epimerase [Chloroflexota bacterium]